MITIENNYGSFEVWTYCVGGQKDGRCIGADEKASKAVQQAITELESELAELKRALILFLQKDL